jgi:hypothetical protein
LCPLSAAFAAVPVPKPPAIDARAYVLIDFQSGRVLAADKAEVQMEPASITKLMTGYVVFRALAEKRLNLSDSVVISERAWKAEGSRTFAQCRHADPRGRVDQGHDRAVGQRRDDRAGREGGRHRRRVRADDEHLRGRARTQEFALQRQLGACPDRLTT